MVMVMGPLAADAEIGAGIAAAAEGESALGVISNEL
jgi:hypothetical protein